MRSLLQLASLTEYNVFKQAPVLHSSLRLHSIPSYGHPPAPAHSSTVDIGMVFGTVANVLP